MIIRRTEQEYKCNVKTWKNTTIYKDQRYAVIINRVTWWFLFIPVFTYQKMANRTR